MTKDFKGTKVNVDIALIIVNNIEKLSIFITDSNKIDATTKQQFLLFYGKFCIYQHIGITILLQTFTDGCLLDITQACTLNLFAGSHRVSNTDWRYLKVGNSSTEQFPLGIGNLGCLNSRNA